jgi:hypothetical protein
MVHPLIVTCCGLRDVAYHCLQQQAHPARAQYQKRCANCTKACVLVSHYTWQLHPIKHTVAGPALPPAVVFVPLVSCAYHVMQPLMAALTDSVCNTTLCGQVWVDSLNPEYLEKALADVVHDIMSALWALLKPSNPLKPHAMAAMQLLGKLGESSDTAAAPATEDCRLAAP